MPTQKAKASEAKWFHSGAMLEVLELIRREMQTEGLRTAALGGVARGKEVEVNLTVGNLTLSDEQMRTLAPHYGKTFKDLPFSTIHFTDCDLAADRKYGELRYKNLVFWSTPKPVEIEGGVAVICQAGSASSSAA